MHFSTPASIGQVDPRLQQHSVLQPALLRVVDPPAVQSLLTFSGDQQLSGGVPVQWGVEAGLHQRALPAQHRHPVQQQHLTLSIASAKI